MEERRHLLLEVAGTPFEMGAQHGTALRDRIALSLETFRREIAEDLVLPAGAPRPTYEQVVQIAAESIAPATEYAPDVMEEIRGIAAGSGNRFEEIFALNSELDVLRVVRSRATDTGAGACSSYAVNGEATADGETYVGWNADSNAGWQRSMVLIKGRPAGAPPFIYWNFAGCVGRPGLNPYLAFSANGIAPSDARSGVPYCIICRKLLQQQDLAGAIQAITSAQRMTGMNYTIGDAAGHIVAVETTAGHAVVIEPQRGAVVHTNHYTVDQFLPYEMSCGAGLLHSQMRQERLGELLIGDCGRRLTLADLQAVHRDHANLPNKICLHDHPAFPHGMTLAATIMQPRAGRLWAAWGPPCRHEFVEYRL